MPRFFNIGRKFWIFVGDLSVTYRIDPGPRLGIHLVDQPDTVQSSHRLSHDETMAIVQSTCEMHVIGNTRGVAPILTS
jgi:hypothetical protein